MIQLELCPLLRTEHRPALCLDVSEKQLKDFPQSMIKRYVPQVPKALIDNLGVILAQAAG